jgi:hypothetical protein
MLLLLLQGIACTAPQQVITATLVWHVDWHCSIYHTTHGATAAAAAAAAAANSYLLAEESTHSCQHICEINAVHLLRLLLPGYCLGQLLHGAGRSHACPP